jgi:hypothetical protein
VVFGGVGLFEIAMNIDDFINKFAIEQFGFSKPIKFSEGFGFSTSKERNQNGYIFVSLYKIYAERQSVINSEQKQIRIIAEVSYGEKLEDGTIRLAPTSIQRKNNWPIDLVASEEFYFDTEKKKFFFQSREIEGAEILKKIELLHILPTKRNLPAFILKVRLFFWRTLVTKSLEFLYWSLIKVLYVISGVKTKRNIWLINENRYSHSEKKEDQKETFAYETINIFGYVASAWAVVFYSLIHLALYTYWYFSRDIHSWGYFTKIFQNTFLTIIYVIPTLVFFEKFIPKTIESLIVFVGTKFRATSYRQIPLKVE